VLGKHREAVPVEIVELLRDADPSLLMTPCGRGQIEDFTEAASTMLHRVYGADVGPGSILPVPGGRTAMSFLASTLIRPHDSVIVFDPAYPAFTRVAQQLGARVHAVPLDPDQDLAPNLGALPPGSAESVRFAALNYPNNPTGTIIDSKHLGAFFELLHPDAVVFNDATYGPLTFNGPPWSLLAQPEAIRHGHRLLELHSLAKMFSLGPVAVSFLVGDKTIISELRDYSEFAWSDQSRLHIEVAVRCLRNHDRLGAMREVFRHRMQRLESTLTALGFETLPSESGMYIVCRVPSAIGGRPVSGAGAAAEVLLEEHNLAVVPWEVEPHEYLRFSGQYSDEDLQGLAALGHDGNLLT
jgi:aspartate/methionine/tyrosine aminotransferase